MKYIYLLIALMFSFVMPAQADDFEGFKSPIVDTAFHAVAHTEAFNNDEQRLNVTEGDHAQYSNDFTGWGIAEVGSGSGDQKRHNNGVRDEVGWPGPILL